MKIRNIRIGTQLIIGFAAILFFVLVVGVVAYVQTNQLHHQTEKMYQHPLQVRRAIGELNNDILTMRLGMKDLMLATSDKEKQAALQMMELSNNNAEREFSIIKEKFLGSTKDVEDAYQAYLIWSTTREENINLALSGEIEQVKENLRNGTIGTYRDEMLSYIEKIDIFAIAKGDELYLASNELKNELHKQLLILLSVILLLLIIISFTLLRNIRKPLKEMNDAILSFHQGNMNARSSYRIKNEFGVLSYSINTLANKVQENTILNEKATSLSAAMLSEDDANKFFQATLSALAHHTGSQVASVYLLSDNKKTFEYFESIGMEDNAKQSFAADSYEGEFGAAIYTRKLQYIKDIPEDTRFQFHTVNVKFIPREIITIPIISGNQVIAIISLATVNKFSPKSIDFIDSIIVTMSARIEGILAYRRIKNFIEEVEQQNCELTTQKSELSAQAVELIQQNAELEMQKNQLDEASQLKTNFLSNMSHELRTPLNSVIALSGVLNRRLANLIPEEEYSYLEIIERNGKNLLLLINDVLNISRIEAGREEIEITKFNINSLIAEVVNMIQPEAKQKSIELLQENEDFQLYISSDADKCRHILQNLIGNAVKFTELGSVKITAQQGQNSLKIKVTDTGIGILADYIPHIFDEFRQADGSTSRRFGGTGLGLAIAKKYANLLGGTISVKSTPNAGSEFTLSLPVSYEEENRIVDEEKINNFKYSIKQPLVKPISSTNKNILLVEDNESAIIQIKDLVEEMGLHIQVAQDAVKALTIMDQVIPDAMILDLMMPDIDGFKLLEILRNAEPTAHIPVLILTAKHITKEELKFLKRNNIHQLIQKGDVDRIKLQNAVSNMLFPEPIVVEQPKWVPQPIEGKPVVLVVEDNPDNMITVKALLDGEYTVIEAVDGSEAIEMAKKYVPNLVLMDIALPIVNGIEAFKEIRRIPKLRHLPVIALTASAMEHDRETILSHGFNAFIAKPIIVKELIKVIREVLYGK